MTTALIIVDMQRLFLDMTDTALPNILKLASHFKSRNLPIFLTQHGHAKRDLKDPNYKNQLVEKMGRDECLVMGTKNWEFLPEIKAIIPAKPESGDGGDVRVIPKNTYDSFINTGLEGILRSKSVERVVVCGVMTNFCCDTTARSAFNRGFQTWMVKDACGSASKTQHEIGLKAFELLCGGLVTTDEVLNRLGG
ncbi:Isochorismatase hydrolase [Rhizodiscina lignyota]|uniref:Isochorismatase hydrolase n=1 Tax=Rhizodiscina lignyota TaxID=1504668 RepID=A0A9P4IET4_9PEZI|nr:Isochorismatase hydrolase [Rhizodiscina lignyota]